MTFVHIPESLDEARTELEGLGALLTAKQWERAAIVYAFTRDGGRGIKSSETVDLALLPHEFAALGIRGLTRPQTVAEYRKAWKSAIEDGQASEVAPGDNVPLPSIPWKDVFGESTKDVQARVFRSVVNDPEQFREALRDQPAAAVELAERVMHTPAVRAAVEHRLAQPIEPRIVETPAPLPRDNAADLLAGINLIMPALRAWRRGEWEPTATQLLVISALGQVIAQVTSDEHYHDDLFSDIQQYLAEATR